MGIMELVNDIFYVMGNLALSPFTSIQHAWTWPSLPGRHRLDFLEANGCILGRHLLPDSFGIAVVLLRTWCVWEQLALSHCDIIVSRSRVKKVWTYQGYQSPRGSKVLAAKEREIYIFSTTSSKVAWSSDWFFQRFHGVSTGSPIDGVIN